MSEEPSPVVVIGPAGASSSGDVHAASSAASASAELALLAVLRGRRRKLCDMTLPDEEHEYRLKGFRFCHWIERWRLACNVLTVSLDVAYMQLGRASAAPVPTPTAQLTTPLDELVLTDKLAIYKCLASAATTSAAWMARLSDSDLLWHIDMADQLGDALSALLSANTRLQMEGALADMRIQLAQLEAHSDLDRFVRKYCKPSDGTHFLDAFYAPLLLRIHIVNRYLSPAVDFIDLETAFPVMHMWAAKVAQWTLFTTTVLGPDYGAELVVHYRDRGSFLFSCHMSGAVNPALAIDVDHLSLHTKFVPAIWLRELRLSVCTKLLQSASSEAEDVRWRRFREVCELCQCVLCIESDSLQRSANVALRLQVFDKAASAVMGLLDGAPQPASEAMAAAWAKLVQAFRATVDAAFGQRVKLHLLEHLTLHQLWDMETHVMSALCSYRGGALNVFVRGMLQHQTPADCERLVGALVEMVFLSGDVGDALATEKALKDVLQALYRECSPSDWAEVAFRVPSVHGLVITKDNWSMHYKFPAVALLSASYTVIKVLVTNLHAHLCAAPATSGAEAAPALDPLASVSTDAAASSLQRMGRWAALLRHWTADAFIPLLNGMDTKHRFVADADCSGWIADHVGFQASVEALCALLGNATALATDERHRKRVRTSWRKFKKDLILFLRSQKKLLLPSLLRFAEGEDLVAAQLQCLESVSDVDADMVFADVPQYATHPEARGLVNVLRFHRPALYARVLRVCEAAVVRGSSDAAALWHTLQPLQLPSTDADWLASPAHWPHHPKFAGVPFILGLSNRVLLEDLSTCVRASRRALKGLGELPTADVRATFEIVFAHYVSHRAIIYTPVISTLAVEEGDAADALACNFEREINELEASIAQAEAVAGAQRRPLLETALARAEALLAVATAALETFSAKYVPRCVGGFSYAQSMLLFARIVHMYHTGNPHLLSRTVCALRETEYEFFCRNMLSLPFALLKEVLDSLRTEIPTRLWLRLVDTMPCLSGVTVDSAHWQTHPHFGALPLFWQLSHRWLESELASLLLAIGDKVMSPAAFASMLDGSQRLMQYLEKHGIFEDSYLLPRIACAVPTVAEANFEDVNNEHSLLEMNELRAIAILKASLKIVKAQPEVVPARQVNRMKRQLRSYQTLILPHLTKEEEKFMPVMLHRFSAAQWSVLLVQLFETYGELFSDDFLVQTLLLATPYEQRLLLQHFVPHYVARRSAVTGRAHVTHMQYMQSALWPSLQRLHFATPNLAADYCKANAPALWQLCVRNGLFALAYSATHSSESLQ